MDGDISDACSVQFRVEVGGPVVVLPFDFEGFVFREGCGERVVIAEVSFPRDGQTTVAVDGGRDLVVVIELLRDRNLLAVALHRQLDVRAIQAVVDFDRLFVSGIVEGDLRGSEAFRDRCFFVHIIVHGDRDIGIVSAVCHFDLASVACCVEGGADGQVSRIHPKFLGGTDGVDLNGVGSNSRRGQFKVLIRYGACDIKGAVVFVHILANIRSDGTAFARPRNGSCDLLDERDNIGGGRSRSFNSVGESEISRRGFTVQSEGGVQRTVDTRIASVFDA